MSGVVVQLMRHATPDAKPAANKRLTASDLCSDSERTIIAEMFTGDSAEAAYCRILLESLTGWTTVTLTEGATASDRYPLSDEYHDRLAAFTAVHGAEALSPAMELCVAKVPLVFKAARGIGVTQ